MCNSTVANPGERGIGQNNVRSALRRSSNDSFVKIGVGT